LDYWIGFVVAGISGCSGKMWSKGVENDLEVDRNDLGDKSVVVGCSGSGSDSWRCRALQKDSYIPDEHDDEQGQVPLWLYPEGDRQGEPQRSRGLGKTGEGVGFGEKGGPEGLWF
jgi:hypothetical protein